VLFEAYHHKVENSTKSHRLYHEACCHCYIETRKPL